MHPYLRYAAGALLLVGLSVSALLLFDASDSRSPSAPWQQFQSPTSSVGTDEDPFARQRYRWMRLRDPETGRIPNNIREKELAVAKRLPKRRATATSWTQRGPGNIGGRTRALAYDVTDPSGNTILAAGVSGGMWRTTDGGSTWTRTFDPAQRPNVTTVVQDSSGGSAETWYAGTGELIGNTAGDRNAGAFYKGDGIFKSTDGGQTWQQLPSTTSDPAEFDNKFDFIYRVRVDPSNDTQEEVYAATYDQIVRSTDGGSTWTTVLQGDISGTGTFASQTDVAVTSTGVVYATMSSDGDRCGLFRSTDGLTWTNITPSGWPGGLTCSNDYFRTVLDVNPSDESEVWFLAYAPGHGPTADGRPISHVMWKYDAQSGTWTNYSDYLPPRGTFGRFATQRGYDMHIQVHPTAENQIFVGGVNLWRVDASGSPSDDAAWIGGYQPGGSALLYQPAGSERQHPDQHTLTFNPNDPLEMLTGSDGGVHRTTDNLAAGDGGVKYTSLNNEYFTTQFYHVCMNPDPTDPTIMGGMQDNGTWRTSSLDPSVDWSRQRSGDGADCEIVNEQNGSETFRYASSQNGFISQYPTNTAAYPQGSTGRFFIHPFEIDPADPSVMYYPAGDTLYRHDDMENNPSQQSNWAALANVVPAGYLITTLEASRRNSAHVLYFGATDADGDATSEPARLYRLDQARSSFTPTEVTGAAFPDGAFPSDIAVSPVSGDEVIVAFSNYGITSLFYSDDGGQSWTDVEGNLGNTPSGPSVRSVSILPQPGANKTTYYAATSVGLYSTTSLSGSTNWTLESPDGIGNVVVNDVETRPSDGQVVVGTHANGVFSRNLPVPVELTNFQSSVQKEDRRITLTWNVNGGISPRLEVEHTYRGQPFDTTNTLEETTPGAYEYAVDSLPAGPHRFRIAQIEGPTEKRTLREAEVVLEPEGAYELTKPAPNPFESSTSMRLTVRESQPVEAMVYNSIGQRVSVLLNRPLGANQPVDLRVTGDNLSSGVYFVNIRGDTFEVTRKVVFVR